MQIAFVDSLGGSAAFVERLAASELDSAAELPGELMLFENAILCRAEVNRNRDGIDASGLAELADTLAMMPLDDEHREQSIIGAFASARVENDALVTSGVVYAKRFPAIARDIIAGRKKLSIEAEIGLARCSECGGTFTSRRNYCAHLLDRASGAVRMISGLKAIGGGTTYVPAGTDTVFDRSKLVFTASDVQEATDGVLKINLNEDAEAHMDEVERLKAEVERLEAAVSASQAVVVQKDDEIAGLRADLVASQMVRTRSIKMLRAGFSDAEIKAVESDLATASDTVIELLLASKALAATPPANEAGEDEPNDSAENEKVVASVSSLVLGDTQAEDVGQSVQWSSELFQ